MELAKLLAGQGGISEQGFHERMARSDELADHDGETCGQCHSIHLQTATSLVRCVAASVLYVYHMRRSVSVSFLQTGQSG